ncbi:MAG: type IV pilus biogenesis/stability protein PilW [Acidiferrobacterales bacterium]
MKFEAILRMVALFAVAMLLSSCSSKPADQKQRELEQTNKVVATNVRLATIYLQRNQLNFATEKAENALKADPKSPDANNMMALLSWRLKEYEKADKYFRKAVWLQPTNSSALNNYGAFLCDRGKIDRSLQYFDRAVENPLYKSRSQALTNAGRCLIKKPDARKAEVYFRRALKFNRNESEALLQLAILNFQSNRLLTARGFMQRYMGTGRKTAESLYLALRIENAMGNKQEAIGYARELQRKFPTSTEASRVKIR